MRTKAFFIMILALLAALFGAAQEAFVVNEGATTTHSVTNNPDNSYVWGMYKDFSPDVEADLLAYEFISTPNTNTVKVQWKLPGMYYLKVTEFDAGSCSNVKVLPVQVLPFNQTIGFEVLESDTSVNLNNNGFSLKLNVLDENGDSITIDNYPVNINFMFNGVAYSQLIDYTNQVLEIKDEWVIIDPGLVNILEVKITGATNVFNEQILPQIGLDVHTRTIYPIPVIEFETERLTINRDERFEHIVQLISGESDGAEYFWSLIPAGGTSTDVSSINGQTASILWDGNPGTYELQVYVKDGNGFLSKTTSQQIEIIESGDLIFNSSNQSTITCSDLTGGNEGTVPGHSESEFKVSYVGDANLLSAKITIKNPDGKYIGINGEELPNQQQPEVEINNPAIGKFLTFAVVDNWENTNSTNAEFEIKIISGINSNQLEIQAVEGTNTTRSISVLAKPVIEFN